MSSNRELSIVILAAGMGKRMLSKKQKILHEVGGKPMIMHVVDAARRVSINPPALVIGPIGGEEVKRLVGPEALYVVQPEALGTGHAARVATDLLQGKSSQVIVTYGDMPLLRQETLENLSQIQAETEAAVVMTTVIGEPTSTFGRIIRNDDGRVTGIVEYANAKKMENGDELIAIRELNVGVYCFDADFLWKNLPELPLRHARSGVEYYLTDMVEIAVSQGRLVEAAVISDDDESLGAGTRAELVEVEKAFRRRANRRWLSAGITLIDPDSIFIDQDVTIGQDTIIWPNSYIQGKTTIGNDCVIGPNTIIRDAELGDRVVAEQCSIENQQVASDQRLLPFTHLT
ncbi:MAG: NTP transferase domain-containing protein [Chloroflexota bacterium]